jgi:hypothetical protein
VSLGSWAANIPNELLAAHLNIDVATVAKFTKTKTPVRPV